MGLIVMTWKLERREVPMDTPLPTLWAQYITFHSLSLRQCFHLKAGIILGIPRQHDQGVGYKKGAQKSDWWTTACIQCNKQRDHGKAQIPQDSNLVCIIPTTKSLPAMLSVLWEYLPSELEFSAQKWGMASTYHSHLNPIFPFATGFQWEIVISCFSFTKDIPRNKCIIIFWKLL